jgi:MFS family permease
MSPSKRFAVKDSLTQEELQKGFKYFVGDGICSQSMVTLTQGAILVGFALKLGASNSVIGLLSAIIALTQLIQIPAIYVVERFRVRRAICVFASATSRTFLLLIAAIPFLFSAQFAVAFLLIALFLNTGIGSIASCSWNSWMHDLIPHDQLGSLFSKRIALAMAISIPLFIASGFIVDYSKTIFPTFELTGYSILFISGFAAGMIGLYFLSHIPETRLVPAEKNQKFLRQIFQPFQDTNFKKLIVFLGVWNFAVNLASPFFTVYLLNVLGFEMSTVIIFNVLSLLMNIAFLQLWGRFSDRFSNKSVMGVCGPLFIICIFLFPFTTVPGFYILTIPLLVAIYLFIGISTAGITLASQNIGLKLAPRGKATAYLAANSFVSSLAAGFSPVLGGVLADVLAGARLSWTWTTSNGQLSFQTLSLNNWGIVFIIAVLIGIYSIHRLAMVQEAGEVKEEVVVRELVHEVRKGIRNASSAVGLQRMIEFPYTLIRRLKPSASAKPSENKGKVTKEGQDEATAEKSGENRETAQDHKDR